MRSLSLHSSPWHTWIHISRWISHACQSEQRTLFLWLWPSFLVVNIHQSNCYRVSQMGQETWQVTRQDHQTGCKEAKSVTAAVSLVSNSNQEVCKVCKLCDVMMTIVRVLILQLLNVFIFSDISLKSSYIQKNSWAVNFYLLFLIILVNLSTVNHA